MLWINFKYFIRGLKMYLTKRVTETNCWNCRRRIHIGEKVLVERIRSYCFNGCAQTRIKGEQKHLNTLLNEIKNDKKI